MEGEGGREVERRAPHRLGACLQVVGPFHENKIFPTRLHWLVCGKINLVGPRH